jgi:competence protein ComEC
MYKKQYISVLVAFGTLLFGVYGMSASMSVIEQGRVPHIKDKAKSGLRNIAAEDLPQEGASKRVVGAEFGTGMLRVRFFAAGHGDSMLLQTPTGQNILIDAGRGSFEEAGDNLVKRRLLPFFASNNIRTLDAFFITHGHWDHVGDPISLLAGIKVQNIYANADTEYIFSAYYPEDRPQPSITVLYRGWSRRFGQLHLEVLHPPRDGLRPSQLTSYSQENNRSLVIRATYGKIRFLLSGDLLYQGEQQILRARINVRADVLKVGHHGLSTVSESWLRAIRPRYAVVSCGDSWRQRFLRPSAKLRQQLADHKVRLLRTDIHGDIVFATNGRKLIHRTYPALRHIPEWYKRRK